MAVLVLGQGRSSSDLTVPSVKLDHIVTTVDSGRFKYLIDNLGPYAGALGDTPFTLKFDSAWITLSIANRPIALFVLGEKESLDIYYKLGENKKIVEVETEWNAQATENNHLYMAYKTFKDVYGNSSLYNLLNFHSPYSQSGLPSLNLWLFQISKFNKSPGLQQLLDWDLPVSIHSCFEDASNFRMEAVYKSNLDDRNYLMNSMVAMGLDSGDVESSQLDVYEADIPVSQLSQLRVYLEGTLMGTKGFSSDVFEISIKDDHYLIKILDNGR